MVPPEDVWVFPIPELLRHVILYSLPKSPSQVIAPPSSQEVLFVNVEFPIVVFLPST